MAAADIGINSGDGSAPHSDKREQEENAQMARRRIATAGHQIPDKEKHDANDEAQKHGARDVRLSEDIMENTRSMFSRKSEKTFTVQVKIRVIEGQRPSCNTIFELRHVGHIQEPINRKHSYLPESQSNNNFSRELRISDSC